MTNTVKYDVVIVGAGPGGIYAAYELSGKNLKIAVFEAGHPLSKRKCPIDGKKVKSCINCKTCSIMSGFGRARFPTVSITSRTTSAAVCTNISVSRRQSNS